MIPTTATALGLLAAFVLPGFIVVLMQERTFKQAVETSPLGQLLHSLYYSFWCYLLLVPVALYFGIDADWVNDLVKRFEDDPAELVWRAGLAMFIPAYIVSRCTYFAERLKPQIERHTWIEKTADVIGISPRHKQPTAWDYFFLKKIKTQVRIEFSDGRVLWGIYADDSFASYAKDGRDLYLHYSYGPFKPTDDNSYQEPPDWNTDPRATSRGTWVKVDDDTIIEFHELPDAPEPETPDDSAGAQDRRSTQAIEQPRAAQATADRTEEVTHDG